MFAFRTSTLPRLGQGLLAALLLATLLLTSACGTDISAQQQADQSKTKFEQTLQQARSVGVPNTQLQSIVQQDQELRTTSAPFNPFDSNSSADYYTNLSTRYTQLRTQTEGLITSSTEQLKTQAQKDIQNFQLALTQASKQGMTVKRFSQTYTQTKSSLSKAKYPKDYIAIIQQANASTQALTLMQDTRSQLDAFENAITQMRKASLDVTALQIQYRDNEQAFKNASTTSEFTRLNQVISAQYSQAVIDSALTIPYIATAKVVQLERQVTLLKNYGQDAGAYEQKLKNYQTAITGKMDLKQYNTFAQQVDKDLASMQDGLVQGEARYLLQQYHQELVAWDKKHQYHSKYDDKDYSLASGYFTQGIGSDLDALVANAVTSEDFKAASAEIKNARFNLQMFMEDYKDKTAYNKVHKTDMKLLDYYNVKQGQVIVVSLVWQALRLYQDGKLVRAFNVTTGRPELPSLPGFWTVLDRRSPTKFTSDAPKDSPYWYPETVIHQAILYQSNGYFLHDSWWRSDYGPGTQFPHEDASGEHSASDGSHGCVNMPPDDALWIYSNTDWNTKIIIY